MHYAEGKVENIGDQIPVDYVTNAIICSAYYYANKKGVHVLHSGSSDKHPITWGMSLYFVKKWWRENPSTKTVNRPNFELIPSRLTFKVDLFFNGFKGKNPIYQFHYISIFL